MPVATIELGKTERHELKTLPEGFVELKQMSYGQWLTRQELALNLKIETAKGSKSTQGEMLMANKEVTLFEFKNSIVDHNLETNSGQKLDFTQLATFEVLDPRIGNEIATYITELHEFMSGDNLGN